MLGRALPLIPSKLTSPSRDYCRPNLPCVYSLARANSRVNRHLGTKFDVLNAEIIVRVDLDMLK